MKVELTVYEGRDIPYLNRISITRDELNERQKDLIKYTVVWKDEEVQ